MHDVEAHEAMQLKLLQPAIAEGWRPVYQRFAVVFDTK
jgi:hypothetical protein